MTTITQHGETVKVHKGMDGALDHFPGALVAALEQAGDGATPTAEEPTRYAPGSKVVLICDDDMYEEMPTLGMIGTVLGYETFKHPNGEEYESAVVEWHGWSYTRAADGRQCSDCLATLEHIAPATGDVLRDAQRRALAEIAAQCDRALFAGGDSEEAATLRIIHRMAEK